jgi:hypothetical protein
MYYELAVGGHAIWSNVYSGQPVYDWLFSHTTAVPEPPATLLMLVGGIVVVSTGRPNRREM